MQKKHSKKTRLLVYEIEKGRIQRKNLSSEEYEQAIKDLCKRLGV
jgi:hypothetical protein